MTLLGRGPSPTRNESKAWTLLVRVAPLALVALSSYCLLFIIVPFYLAGIDRIPIRRILTEDEYSYWYLFGLPGVGVALIVVSYLKLLAAILWLLSAIDFIQRRRWAILVVILISPVPILYISLSAYAEKIWDWLY